MRTINLLPKLKQQELKYEAHFHSIKVVIWISLVTFVLVALAQAGTKLYLQNQVKLIENTITILKQQTTQEENTVIRSKVKEVNSVIADYKDLAVAAPKWSRVLRAFAKLPPNNVRINSFSVDQKKKLVTISGFSPTREGVLELFENIKADDKNFTGIVNPFENIARPYNVSFNFTFSVNEELLK
jgi:hypothetical protein